ncbi:MAG: D-alanyl-D-alanine carboxypeptidase [Clostridia bacterium]|nr:D-alanyl-D-alanine carboxypeptidase [Clostridia bacterium]
MNTKITEEKVFKATKPRRDLAVIPSKGYFVVLSVTIVLLLSFLVAFFAVFASVDGDNGGSSGGAVNGGVGDFNDGDDDNNGNANANGGNSNNNPQSQPNSSSIGAGVSVDGNSLGKTVAKRSSYLSKSSASVKKIGEQRRSDNIILVDLDTYESIAEKSADTRIYPASMTKVMSLLVACENAKSLKAKLTVTKDICKYAVDMDGSGFLSEKNNLGDELSVQDLLYLTSYKSDTIAVIMLAKHVAGNEEAFVKLMNKKAQELGLKNTHFDNVTGLHSDNNYTTCREMAAIMAYALDNPLCNELLTSIKAYKLNLASNDYTLWSPSWYQSRFSENPKLSTVTVKGGKTGYIDESGFCLVSYAVGRNSGKKYVQVSVGEPKGSGFTEALSVEDIKYVYNTYAN